MKVLTRSFWTRWLIRVGARAIKLATRRNLWLLRDDHGNAHYLLMKAGPPLAGTMMRCFGSRRERAITVTIHTSFHNAGQT